jgi:hypothetical protein
VSTGVVGMKRWKPYLELCYRVRGDCAEGDKDDKLLGGAGIEKRVCENEGTWKVRVAQEKRGVDLLPMWCSCHCGALRSWAAGEDGANCYDEGIWDGSRRRNKRKRRKRERGNKDVRPRVEENDSARRDERGGGG